MPTVWGSLGVLRHLVIKKRRANQTCSGNESWDYLLNNPTTGFLYSGIPKTWNPNTRLAFQTAGLAKPFPIAPANPPPSLVLQPGRLSPSSRVLPFLAVSNQYLFANPNLEKFAQSQRVFNPTHFWTRPRPPPLPQTPKPSPRTAGGRGCRWAGAGAASRSGSLVGIPRETRCPTVRCSIFHRNPPQTSGSMSADIAETCRTLKRENYTSLDPKQQKKTSCNLRD